MARSMLLCAAVAAAFFMVSAPANAQVIFSDGFETYAAGSNINGQGGWNDFGGSQLTTVSSTRAHTGANSMRLSEGTDTIGGTTTGYGSDVYRNFAANPLTAADFTGIFNYSYWQFINAPVNSVAFMFMSTGSMPNTFQ